MKTLDEVIHGYECCLAINCAECPYVNWNNTDVVRCDPTDKDDDALHYLKEYRQKQKWLEESERYYSEHGANYEQAVKDLTAKEQFYNDCVKRCTEIINEYEKMVADYLSFNNPALTWDELKQMEGKPVGVEALLYKQWAVIAYVGDKYIRFEGADLYAPESRTYMGKDNGWQAYRKERE